MADGLDMKSRVQSDLLIDAEKVEIEDLGGGLKRQLLGYNGELMLVRVWFDEGAVGELHEHFHTQASYIESGVFEVTVGSETRTLKAGDSFFIPSHTMHGAVCKEKGVLLDTFTPVREDFLSQEDK